MHINFTFRHLDATEGMKQHTEERITRLEKYFQQTPDSIHVIFSVEHNQHQAEVTLNVEGQTLVGHAESGDMYASIDSAISKLEEQLRRLKEKRTHHKGHMSASGHQG